MLNRLRIISYYIPLAPRPGVKFDAEPLIPPKVRERYRAQNDPKTTFLVNKLYSHEDKNTIPLDERHHFGLGTLTRLLINASIPCFVTLDMMGSIEFSLINIGLTLAAVGFNQPSDRMDEIENTLDRLESHKDSLNKDENPRQTVDYVQG